MLRGGKFFRRLSLTEVVGLTVITNHFLWLCSKWTRPHLVDGFRPIHKLSGICDREYHGLQGTSRWFCKIYCGKTVIVGLRGCFHKQSATNGEDFCRPTRRFSVAILTGLQGKATPYTAERCRVVRLGDLGERKKRPHLVENQISKSLKELFK